MHNDDLSKAYQSMIRVPVGFLIPDDNYYLFSEVFDAVRCCRELIQNKELGAISMQIDYRIQPKFDKAFSDKKGLPPISDGDSLISERNGEYIIKGRKDMGFLFFLSHFGIKYNIPCFASDNLTLPYEERMQFIVSNLIDLHNKYGNIAHVCDSSHAMSIKKIIGLRMN